MSFCCRHLWTPDLRLITAHYKIFRLSVVLWTACGFIPSATAQLQTALEVRSLSFDEADSRKEVDLTGVVIFSDPPGTIYIQDQTAGTFFRPGNAAYPKPGDEVRIRGRTFPGLYLPGIEEASFDILQYKGLPAALDATFDDLLSGRFHYQRVAIEGIVRSISPDKEATSLVRVAMGTRMIEVKVEQAPEERGLLVDSRVRVSGMAVGHINARRQLVLPYLRCQLWSAFEIIKPAPVSEEIPTVSARQLLNFKVDGQGGHRVRVRGDVLAVFPEGELFLRDANVAIRVKLLERNPNIKVGNSVELIGFPEMKEFSASLTNAIVSGIDVAKNTPLPVDASLEELMSGSFDANLVSVTGILNDWYRDGTGGILVLQEKGETIQARTPFLPESLLAGSLLKIYGICEVKSTRGKNYNSRPDLVVLRLRTEQDIISLKAPKWWNARRLATILVILLVAFLLAALWIALLRRQVANQTTALRYRIESEAALEERQRIAREFHDTLEQEMAGLSIRLDAAVVRCVDEKMQGLLEGSRGLVSRIQIETRNLVSDLRDYPDEHADLKSALRDLAEQQPSGIGPAIELDLADMPSLPSRRVHHLSMMAREALTNALKHAGATRVVIKTAVMDEVLVMQISDDGCGFDTEAKTHGMAGHFGCVGIQERCGKIGAKATWKSKSGEGAILEIRLPLLAELDR